MPFRRAIAADLSRLLAIDGGVKRDPTHPAWLRRAFADRAVWKRTAAKEIIAYGVFRRSFFDRWFVESLYVSPQHRRAGYGSQLLTFLEARTKPQREIWTSTNRSNRPMRQLLK